MKVDPRINAVKGQAAGGKSLGGAKGRTTQSRPEIISMISMENQEASRLDPNSLQEAHSLLEQLLFQVEQDKGETIEEVHRLEDRCLIKLW